MQTCWQGGGVQIESFLRGLEKMLVFLEPVEDVPERLERSLKGCADVLGALVVPAGSGADENKR